MATAGCTGRSQHDHPALLLLGVEQRGVEVQLGRGIVSDDSHRRCGYDHIVRRMEEEETLVHHTTIVRYCADVLGSLRREELKNLRRLLAATTLVGSRRPDSFT